MSTNFDFELLNEAIEQAPTAGFGPQVNFGKMTMQVSVVHWDSGKPVITAFTNQKVVKPDYLQITFECDLSELNPVLTNPYRRRVDVRVSGRKTDGTKDPKALTDWSETVEPSLKALLGKDWSKKLAKGVYLEFEDVETVELSKSGGKKGYQPKDKVTGEFKVNETTGEPLFYINTVPHFKRVFKSKAECSAAREERYSKSNGATADLADDESEIPAEVIATAKGLLQAVGLEQAKTILETTPPYNAYNTEALIQAANPL